MLRHHARSGNNTLYLGTTLGVYSLNDSSSDWEVFDNNLPNVAVRDLEIHEEDAKLFAATYGRGVFSSSIPRIKPQVDVRIISINNSSSSINCGSNITPEITIKNQGVNVLTSMDVEYTIEGALHTHRWVGALNTEEEKVINLPSITVSKGTHTISVKALVTNDAYSTNNNAESYFIINEESNTPTTVNTFEDILNDNLLAETLTSKIDTWVLGAPNKTMLNAASSGVNAYVTNLTENYPNSTINYLYTKCYNLSKIDAPVLKFKMAFDIEENWDYLVVEYTTDQGGNWSILGSSSDPNWYNSNSTDNGIPGAQWTGEGEDANALGGTNATIHDYSYNLSALATETNVIFRFKLVADVAVNEEGVLIDDLVISGTILNLDDNVLKNSFSVYPNPSKDLFNLTWRENGEATLSLYDYTGKLVAEEEQIKNNKYLLDLSNFSKGLYLVKIKINGKEATNKIILE